MCSTAWCRQEMLGPSNSYADCMCRDELPTVSQAHKADYLGSAESVALNSDGITKHQQEKAASDERHGVGSS